MTVIIDLWASALSLGWVAANLRGRWEETMRRTNDARRRTRACALAAVLTSAVVILSGGATAVEKHKFTEEEVRSMLTKRVA